MLSVECALGSSLDVPWGRCVSEDDVHSFEARPSVDHVYFSLNMTNKQNKQSMVSVKRFQWELVSRSEHETKKECKVTVPEAGFVWTFWWHHLEGNCAEVHTKVAMQRIIEPAPLD